MGRGAIQMRVSMGGFLEEVRPREQEAGPAGIWEEPAFQAQHFLGLPASLLPQAEPEPEAEPPPHQPGCAFSQGSVLPAELGPLRLCLPRPPACSPGADAAVSLAQGCKDLCHIPKAM